MTEKTTEALKRVLDYVEQTAQFIPHDLDDEGIAVAALLREALAEPVKQEPVELTDDEFLAKVGYQHRYAGSF